MCHRFTETLFTKLNDSLRVQHHGENIGCTPNHISSEYTKRIRLGAGRVAIQEDDTILVLLRLHKTAA